MVAVSLAILSETSFCSDMETVLEVSASLLLILLSAVPLHAVSINAVIKAAIIAAVNLLFFITDSSLLWFVVCSDIIIDGLLKFNFKGCLKFTLNLLYKSRLADGS